MKYYSLLLILIFLIPIYADIMVVEAYKPTKSIQGFDGQNEIFIMYDDKNTNYIILQNELGISEHYDAKVKKYNDKSFSMKNPESGIAVFAHYDTNDNSYRLTVLTSTGILKFNGVLSIFSGVVVRDDHVDQQEKSPVITTPSERIEPKSSIGADVSKWNVSNAGRTDRSDDMLFTVTADRVQSITLGQDYDKMFKVYNARNSERLVGAEVHLEIERDGFIYKK